MGPVDGFLLVIAAIFIVGIVGELVFARTGVPDVVWLITVGIVIGPVAGWVPRASLVRIAPYFGALTLVIVLFDGGTEIRLHDLGRAAPRAALTALVGFVFSVAVVATGSMGAARVGWLSDWGWLQAVTLGAIVGGSSSAVIMPALRKAGLRPALESVLKLESALTDVLCVVVTGACLRIHTSGVAQGTQAAVTLGTSFGIGLGGGALVGILTLFVLRRLTRSAYAYPLMLGVLLALYVGVDELGGSAGLAILTAAVIVGNAPSLSRSVGLAHTAFLGEGIHSVHDQVTFIIKSFFFTFIGAMLSPPWSVIALGLGFGLLLLLARVPAVALAALGSKLSRVERGLVTVSLPRGLAAGVLAIMPASVEPPMPGTSGLSTVVFSCVLTTILVFACGFPIFKRMLPETPEEDEGAPAVAAATAEKPP